MATDHMGVDFVKESHSIALYLSCQVHVMPQYSVHAPWIYTYTCSCITVTAPGAEVCQVLTEYHWLPTWR